MSTALLAPLAVAERCQHPVRTCLVPSGVAEMVPSIRALVPVATSFLRPPTASATSLVIMTCEAGHCRPETVCVEAERVMVWLQVATWWCIRQAAVPGLVQVAASASWAPVLPALQRLVVF